MDKENDSAIIALNKAMNSLGKRLAVIEKNQKIILRDLRIISIKEKRFTRSIRRLDNEFNAGLESNAKIKKDLQQTKEKNYLFTRVINKLITYSGKKADELKSLKRKFYKLWRITIGDKKPFAGTAELKPKDSARGGVQPGKPATGTEKSKKDKKKLQEGMG